MTLSIPTHLKRYLEKRNFSDLQCLACNDYSIILSALKPSTSKTHPSNINIDNEFSLDEEVDTHLENVIVKVVKFGEAPSQIEKEFAKEQKIIKSLMTSRESPNLNISRNDFLVQNCPIENSSNIVDIYSVKRLKLKHKHHHLLPLNLDDNQLHHRRHHRRHSDNVSHQAGKTIKQTTSYGMMVMEKMDIDLMDYILQSEILSMKKIKFIFKEICKAVNYLHNQKGIVHLDIKPENILLNVIGQYILQVKICDFGCAKKCKFAKQKAEGKLKLLKLSSSVSSSSSLSLSTSSSSSLSSSVEDKRSVSKKGSPIELTISNVLNMTSAEIESKVLKPQRLAHNRFGTLNYLPPECVERFKVKAAIQLDKVDIYALGVILFTMVVQQFPFVYVSRVPKKKNKVKNNSDDDDNSHNDVDIDDSEHKREDKDEGEDGLEESKFDAKLNANHYADKLKISQNIEEKIREKFKNCKKEVRDSVVELLLSMMHENPSYRPSISEVLSHPFLSS